MPVSAGFPFRIVSVGLEGESTLVPTGILDSEGDGNAGSTNELEGWRNVMRTSTLPFGAASLPRLAPPCRKELEDRCIIVLSYGGLVGLTQLHISRVSIPIASTNIYLKYMYNFDGFFFSFAYGPTLLFLPLFFTGRPSFLPARRRPRADARGARTGASRATAAAVAADVRALRGFLVTVAGAEEASKAPIINSFA